MTTDRPSVAQSAINRWNAGADEFNQWDALGQDEKDELIEAEKERLASTDRLSVDSGIVQ